MKLTLAMVNELPATGSLVVVHNRSQREMVKRLTREHRGPDLLAVTTVVAVHTRQMAEAYLTDPGVPVIIDPSFRENVSGSVWNLVSHLLTAQNGEVDAAD